jgi:hypothetical protein
MSRKCAISEQGRPLWSKVTWEIAAKVKKGKRLAKTCLGKAIHDEEKGGER